MCLPFKYIILGQCYTINCLSFRRNEKRLLIGASLLCFVINGVINGYGCC